MCKEDIKPVVSQTCNEQDCKKPKIRIDVKLQVDFDRVIESANIQKAFEDTFALEISESLGISTDRVIIVSITRGSVKVKFDLVAGETVNSGAANMESADARSLKALAKSFEGNLNVLPVTFVGSLIHIFSLHFRRSNGQSSKVTKMFHMFALFCLIILIFVITGFLQQTSERGNICAFGGPRLLHRYYHRGRRR